MGLMGITNMASNKQDVACSIAPYFKIKDGKHDAFKAVVTKIVNRCKNPKSGCNEERQLNYCWSFSECGQFAFCRETYASAQGFLNHMANVNDFMEDLTKTYADVERVEIHATAGDVEFLKQQDSLKPLPISYYILSEDGLRKSF